MDRYITASESEKLSAFEDKTLVDLLIEKGAGITELLPEGLKEDRIASAETIENNVRKLITDELPTNPAYYEKMSILLDTLIKKRLAEDLEYEKYLNEMSEFASEVKNPSMAIDYPDQINTRAKQALFDNLDKNQEVTLNLHAAVISSRSDEWRTYPLRERAVKNAVRGVLAELDDSEINKIFEIIRNQDEY